MENLDFIHIDKIMDKIIRIWKFNPTLSFAELITYAFGNNIPSYISDEDFVNRLDIRYK